MGPRLESTWTVVAAVTAATGVAVCLARFGPLLTVGVFVLVALLGVMTALPWLPELTWRARPLRYAGPLSGAVAVVLLGLAVVVGGWSLLLVGVLVVTEPGVLRRLDAWRHDDRPEQPRPEELPAPHLLDDAALLRAWHASHEALGRARTAEARLRVVQMRARYLDELDRRDVAEGSR